MTIKELKELLEQYDENMTVRIFDSYSGFEKALLGNTYKHLPIYKKKLQKWITL